MTKQSKTKDSATQIEGDSISLRRAQIAQMAEELEAGGKIEYLVPLYRKYARACRDIEIIEAAERRVNRINKVS